MKFLDAAEQSDAIALVLSGAATVDEVAAVFDVEPWQFMHLVYPEPAVPPERERTCWCKECDDGRATAAPMPPSDPASP